MKSGGVHPVKEDIKKADKEKKLLEQKELAMLFKPVQMQKIEKGFSRHNRVDWLVNFD